MKIKHLALVQDSGNQEYYTDEAIISRVKRVLGVIDLDPASNPLANETVGAVTFFTKSDDGLSRDWHDKVFMNHPFGKGENACNRYLKDGKGHKKGDYNCKKRICNDPKYAHYRGHHIDVDIPSNLDWVQHLESQFNKGNVTEAINIAFAELSSSWGQILTNGVYCIPNERVNYYQYNPEKQALVKDRGVTKGSILRYWGNNPDEFAKVFSEIGTVHQPYNIKSGGL